MDLQLTGKVAFVSGSTAGIGYGIAAALAREGARVIVNGRTAASVDRAVAAIRATTAAEVRGFAGDLSEASSVPALASVFPEVDILVNNLGIFEAKPFEEIPDADWLRLFDVNVVAAVRLTRLYLPALRRANWGRIVFVSSESAVQIPPEMIHYGASKAALQAVSRGLAETLAGTGITVNSVLPGPTRSRSVAEFVDELAKASGVTFAEFERDFFSRIRPTSLLRRFATPEEVAALVAYVVSPLAAATTGAQLRVDGGVLKSAF